MIRSAVSLALLLPGAQGSYEEWPGDQKVTVADEKDAFTDNISGVYYDAGESQENDVVLSVRNKPSTLYTLRYNSASSIWEEAESKSLHYANDPDGDPDSEDLTKTDGSSPNIYVCTERDNEENGSRLTVLLFRDEPGASSLTALQEWDLTSDIKPVEDNLGWEAITWVPDSYLVSHGLVDESRDGELYDPNNYPKHGSGLIFVGLEDEGEVFGYALTHDNEYLAGSAGWNSTVPATEVSSSASFTRITKFSTELEGIMALHFDRVSPSEGYLWAFCDNNCKGHSSVLQVDSKRGGFESIAKYKRPDDMPNINNEGFTSFPDSRCDSSTNLKGALWSDDSVTDGHALRQGTMPCGDFVH